MEHTQINKAESQLRLELNTDFYNIKTILLASKEFTKNFWISLEKNNNSIFVYICPKPESYGKVDMNNLAFEFYNYVLGIMQSSLIHNQQKSL